MADQPYAIAQMRVVTAQVATALASAGVISLSALPDYSAFTTVPVDYGGALRHAAFWLAVASRALGDRALATSAASAAAQAAPYVANTAITEGMAEVLTQAANAIKASIVANPAAMKTTSGSLANIAYTKLAVMPNQLAAAAAADTSIMGQIRNFMTGLGRLLTALKVIAVIGGIAGLSGVAWWAWKRSRAKAA